MRGIDTNVLVRYLTRDDEQQYQKAETFLERESSVDVPCYVNHVVLCETLWVLEAAYGKSRADLADLIEKLLRTKQLLLEQPSLVQAALYDFQTSNADFADCLIGRLNQQRRVRRHRDVRPRSWHAGHVRLALSTFLRTAVASPESASRTYRPLCVGHSFA